MTLSFQCYLKRASQPITVKVSHCLLINTTFKKHHLTNLNLASVYAISFTEVLIETGPTQTQKPVITHSEEKITDSIKR